MTGYGKQLYDRLPPLYKRKDAEIKPVPLPLQRYLEVAGVGLDFMAEKIEGNNNLYDMDKVPKELLPHIANMLGYKFPYEMSEIEQRNFLKVLPYLYRFKGTAKVFDYLGQVVYGSQTRVHSNYRLNDNDLIPYKHLIDVYIEVNGNLTDVVIRSERYRKFAEDFRPLNTAINPIVQLFYTDVYLKRFNDDVMRTSIMTAKAIDLYDRNRQRDTEKIKLLNFASESYNVGRVNDSYSVDKAITPPTSEVFFRNYKDDSTEDYATTRGGTLNRGTLNNGGFILNKPSVRTRL